MAVPSRIFVGITLFGLLCCVLLVPYTVLVVACREQYAADLPGIPCADIPIGTRLLLVLASVFAVAFTVLSWRALLAGARRDRARRKLQSEGKPDPLKEQEPPAG